MNKAVRALLTGVLLFSMASSVFAEGASEDVDYTTGTPWMDTDLDGNVTADTPVDLKDNYALWANKEKILSLEFQDGIPSAGIDIDVTLKANADKVAMFQGEAPTEHDARLAYDYYFLLTDWESRDAVGVAPLKEMIDVVEGIDSLDALTDYFVNTPGEDRLFCLWRTEVQQDTENEGQSILSVKNNHFFFRDPAEYREMTEVGEAQKAAYSDFCRKMLEKLGYTEEEAEQKIDNCFEWESMLNADRASAEERETSEYKSGTDNHYTRDELIAASPDVPIVESLEKADGYPAMEKYLITEPGYFEKLNEVYTEENLPLIRDYLILHGTWAVADVLDWESYTLMNDCTELAAGNEPFESDRETYCETDAYDDVNMVLAWPVARLYVEKYTSPEDKERISKLVDEIIDAYYGILDDADFISDETRAGAYAKLDNMTKNVLYPDNWEPYSFEDVDFKSKEDGGTLWEAFRAITKHNHDKAVKDATAPYDRTLWDGLPFVVNCTYTPSVNGIYIYAAYAQGGNYNPDMTDEELYANTGNAIAHEISHAFDAFGAQYDKNGNFINWWTEEDFAVFQEKNKKLAAYFDAIHPWEGVNIDGERVIGEACADMAALKCMLRIAAEKPDFDYDAFFRAYANRYACKETLETVMMRLEDVHPLRYLRINTNLQQYDEFLDFYGITEGDNMYLAPEDRVAIW